MLLVLTYDGRALRLTDERWQHIVTEHPEIAPELNRVIQTLRHPQRVQMGDHGERIASRSISEPPFNGHHLVVVNLEEGSRSGFVLTAYRTRRLSTRRITLWTP